jgi:tetratricopeptide (TPR) repeat protein
LTASGNTAELARAYLARGTAWGREANDRIKDLTTAIKLRPNYLEPLRWRASTYTKTSPPNLEAAVADYTEYLKIKPSAEVNNSRAALYEQKGDKVKAISDYRAALALDPNNSTAKEKLAKLAPTTAVTPTQPTTSSPKPTTAEQFLAEGSRKAFQKDYDGAITSLSECLRLKPEAVECYAFRGFALGMKGDPTAAKPDFEAAIKLAPNQPEIYLLRGLTFVRVGSKAEAVKDFRSVLRLDPNNREAKDALQRLGEQP